MKAYGNLTNRLEEGRQFSNILPGVDITMYHYSDRTCYYITHVVDDKHIFVKRYFVCADREKADGMGHQEWKYFKSYKDYSQYINSSVEYDPSFEATEEEWVFRYGKWMRRITFTEENYCSDRELQSLKKNGYYYRYFDLSGKISIGVRDYYYDWEF